jgi:hypothetical protein
MRRGMLGRTRAGVGTGSADVSGGGEGPVMSRAFISEGDGVGGHGESKGQASGGDAPMSRELSVFSSFSITDRACAGLPCSDPHVRKQMLD